MTAIAERPAGHVAAGELRSVTSTRRAPIRHRRRCGVSPLSLTAAGLTLRREYSEWSLVSVVIGAASMLPMGGTVSAVLLSLYLMSGPGLALFALVSFPVVCTLSAPIVGLSVAAAATALLAQFSHFPTYLLLCTALIVNTGAAAWAYAYTTAAPMSSSESLALQRFHHVASSLTTLPRRLLTAWAPLVLLYGGLSIWSISIPFLRSAAYSEFGLLASPGGAVLIVAAVLVLSSILVALRAGQLGVACLGLLGLIVVLRLTGTVITEMPVYGWTYKHIGVVEFLRTYHTLPPAADIYGQWPAFFTLAAWFTSITHAGILGVAHVFAPLIHIVLALGVLTLTRALRFSRRSAVLAATIVEITNWVGQDYFSPQALAFPLALAVVTMMILSKRVAGAAALGTFLFACLIPLHQLTPYWLLMALVALLIAGWIKPWWVVAVCGVLLVLYLLPRWGTVNMYGLVSGLNPLRNAQSNVVAHGEDTAKFFTSLVCRGLAVSVFAIAAVAAVVLRRRRLPVWPQMAIAGCAVLMLGGVNYGGEAIFRVFLYSLPGLAALIAPVFVGMLTARPDRLRNTFGKGFVICCAGWFLVAGMQGYFGLWGQVSVTRTQYQVARAIMQYPGDIRIIPMSLGGMPDRSSALYVDKALRDKNFDEPISWTDPGVFERFPMGLVQQITDESAQASGVVYLAVTMQDRRAVNYYGYATAEQLGKFLGQVQDSAHWRLVFNSPELQLYRYVK